MFYGCQEGQTGGGSGVAERPKGGGIVSQENCCQPSRASPVATDGRPLYCSPRLKHLLWWTLLATGLAPTPHPPSHSPAQAHSEPAPSGQLSVCPGRFWVLEGEEM